MYIIVLIGHLKLWFLAAGKPIKFEKVKNPTKEQIDDLHQKFLIQLEEVFEMHKHNYVNNPEETYLQFV